MPLGGITPGWDESVPADSENAGLGALRIRSFQTAVQQILDSEHNFPSAGGANTGYHRLGSGRAFYDVESNVSSSGTDGRLMVTSDTSRFFHVGSAGTMFLGGQASPQLSAPGQTSYWAIETGTISGGWNSNGSVTVAIPNSGFSSTPIVMVTALVPNAGPFNQHVIAYLATNPTPTSFSVVAWDQASNSAVSRANALWVAIGTRAL